MGKKGKFEFDAGDFLAYILKKFKLLVIVSLIAAFIAGVCSLFIKNRFLSEANLVPTAQTNVPRSLLENGYDGNLMGAGTENEVNLLLQVVNSEDIFIGLNKKIDLAKHYKFKKTSNSRDSKLVNKFYSNFKCSRTEYNTVSVQAWDEDPKFACEIVKEVIKQVDTVFNKMQHDRMLQFMASVKSEYDSVKIYVDRIQDSISLLSNMGVYDVGVQTQELNKAYYKALMKGRTDIADKIQARLKFLGAHGGQLATLYYKLDKYNKNLADMEIKLSIARVAVKQNITHIYVANVPQIPDTKDSPKRSIIVLIAAIATFFTTLFAFIIYDNIKKLI